MRCHGNQFGPHKIGLGHSSMKLIWPPSTDFMTCFISMCNMIPRPWPLTFWCLIWVTWPGASVEHIWLPSSSYLFELLEYAVIKHRFPDPVARQMTLQEQPFYVPLVGGGPSHYHASMKFIWPPCTEISHSLVVYIIWLCYLDVWP